MFNFDKPYKSIEELCSVLKNRNLDIGQENAAINLLQLYGYYPLINGYSKPFLDSNKKKADTYKNESSLEDIYSLYLIDSEFQELFLGSVLKIEKHLANTLGNEIAANFGVDHRNSYLSYIFKNNGNDKDYKYTDSPNSYLNSNNYTGSRTNKLLKTINLDIYHCKNNPTAYYKKNHNHIPPWILVQNLTFGEIIRYYQIQNIKIKTNIVNEMITPIDNESMKKKKVLFYSEIQLLSFFRNRAAHSSPIYIFRINKKQHGNFYFANKKTLKRYLGPEVFENSDSSSLGTNDLYAAFLALLLLNRDNTQRHLLIDKLSSIESKYKNSPQFTTYYENYIHEAGLPINYIERLERASNRLVMNEIGSKKILQEDKDGQIHSYSIHFLKHEPVSLGMMRKVYISKAGKKYHRYKNCKFINSTKTNVVPLKEAMDKDLSPCKICEEKYNKK